MAFKAANVNHLMAATDLALDKGLPANVDAERLVLGSIMIQDSAYLQAAGVLEPDDFSLEKHRKIFRRMGDLYERGEAIDHFTVANELNRKGELESVDGLSYLVSLDEGLPQIANLDAYIRIVKDKSLLRKIILAAEKVIHRSMIGEESPEEILASAEESFLGLSGAQSTQALMRPGQIIETYQGGLSAFLDPSKRIKGVSTGYVKLDEMTSGFHGGELIILAGRPAMGKTALALNIAQHVACGPSPKTVAIFSLEMSRESLLTRMICAAARVDQQRFRMGFLNQEERRRLQQAASELSDAPLFIDDSAAANLMDIHSKLRRLRAEHGLGLVVIDYLQLMQARGKFDNRTTEVSALSRGLKLLAKDMDVPFLVLSQLSRATETRQGDHRPQLSDLRESGSIEQDADVVLFVFREEVYKPDREDLRGRAELIIGKQRNGPTGRIRLVFLRECTKFENPLDDIEEPPAE